MAIKSGNGLKGEVGFWNPKEAPHCQAYAKAHGLKRITRCQKLSQGKKLIKDKWKLLDYMCKLMETCKLRSNKNL
jgi:hypothetical protein